MKKLILLAVLFTVTTSQAFGALANNKLRVVTTLPDYQVLTQAIGGDRVSVEAIVRGDQDAHFIRPKPSFVTLLRRADVLIATGLDLELWLPTVVNKSGNTHIRSGQPGYVAVAQGMKMLEKPAVMSRSEGGVHIYGNPHFTNDPINMKMVIRNITTGLITNDPAGKDIYQANRDLLLDRMDRKLFGAPLVEMLGGDTLCEMAQGGTLIDFLKSHQYQGQPLLDSLGGWLGKMLPLRGMPMVTYHRNWVYFQQLFGLIDAGTIEPKPGIPPSAKHVAELVDQMKIRQVKLLLAANYFDAQKVRTVAKRVGAAAIIVPLYVGGAPGTTDYFQLVDYWVDHLMAAAADKGLLAVAPTGKATP